MFMTKLEKKTLEKINYFFRRYILSVRVNAANSTAFNCFFFNLN